MPKKSRTSKILMFDLSPEAANLWFDIGSLVLLAGCVAVAAGTYLVWKTGAIKERFADERIFANETETARAKESAEQAKERTASLEAETEILRNENLQLQRDIAGRSLSDRQSEAIAGAARGKVAEAIIIWSNNPEAAVFAMKIDFALASGGVAMQEPQLGSTPMTFPQLDSSTGIFVYEPGFANDNALNGPLAIALKAGGLLPSGGVRPNVAKDLPNIPLIIVGSKPFTTMLGKTY